MLALAFPFALFFILFSSSSAHSIHNDRKTLLEFKALIVNDPHNSMANWSPANPLRNWTGITCIRRPQMDRVIALNLTTMDMQGRISPSLANLSFLGLLDLSFNAFHGQIPPQLGRLFRLRVLWLNVNQLEGSIPSQLASCHNLVELELEYNMLSGSIPVELGSLPHLQKLILGANSLSGTIPSSIGNLSSLTHLGMRNNTLTGPIPPQLGLLTRLQSLHIYENKLSGNIPTSLSNISSLIDLEISTNNLAGDIPQELCLLTSLQFIYLAENKLSGNIPTCLSNLSNLIVLDISSNNLNGSISQKLSLPTSLQILYFFENKLTGNIPSSLSNVSSLVELSIYNNKLRGNIPEFGAKLHNLAVLSAWGNQLNGNIPNSIGNCSKLTLLALSHNYLHGSVPLELGKLSLLELLKLEYNQLDSGSAMNMPFLTALTNCSHLRILGLLDNKLRGILPFTVGKLSTNLSIMSLSHNTIEGNIPSQINNLTSLTFLDLSGNFLNGSIPSLKNLVNLERVGFRNNRLEGNIPNEFKPLKHLGLLDLSNNMLSGKIPSSLCQLKQLRMLYLHHNYLSNKIPANLGDCTNLELLDLSHNRLSGSIPQEIAMLSNIQFYFNLSWNLLEGSLPREISKIVTVQAIDISANQLTGPIPALLGKCIALQSLNLSRNNFQGSIPNSLGDLQNLMVLDLSSNSLSGTIPIALKMLKTLSYLNLSFNKLTGEISKGEFAANQTISLIGNSGLCGPQGYLLHACPTSRSHFHIMKEVLLPVIIAGFTLCCLLLAYLWRRKLQKQSFGFPQAFLQKVEHQRITYQELARATNGFLEANLLGKGSFGSVYKGILNDGTFIAVKVLNLQNDQAEKSFAVECSILQKVRHRNLVKIITSCSNSSFKGLVFEFMCNGSLEDNLYPHRDDSNGDKSCELGLETRLNIAIDVAHAIEYLHCYSQVQVVHCDIKPSNVLLDEDMSGHVTDFGIARLIGATSTASLTSTFALKGSTGYIAPEYGLGEPISTKGDVYSFGILLLEMFTRKKPTCDMFVGELNLHKWVNFAFPNRVNEIIDNNLLNEVNGDTFEGNDIYKCLLSLLRVGLHCSNDSPKERPAIRDVVKALENFKDELVGNTVVSKGLRQSISILLSNTSATRNVATTSNDQSSSTF